MLDMDGTILDLAYDNYMWLTHVPTRWAEQNDMSLDEARHYLLNKFGEAQGDLRWYCLDHWSDHLGLDGRMCNARLLSDLSAESETGAIAYDGKEVARRAFKLGAFAGKVGVSVKSEGEGVGFAADVSSKDPARRALSVAHQSVYCLATSVRPCCNA